MNFFDLASRLQAILLLADPAQQARAVAALQADFPDLPLGDWLSRKPRAATATALAAPAPPLGGETGETWSNGIANQSVRPLRLERPRTLDDIVNAVAGAEAEGLRVRATATGRSFSDIMLTEDVLLDMTALAGPVAVDTAVLRAGADPGTLHGTRAGTTISALIQDLEGRGLALANIGGYTGQTFVGAACTATHGSGVTLPPICDLLESVLLVAGGAAVYRVEPSGGITDPAAHQAKYPGIRLLQDDDAFASVIVGLGCFGVIHSVILRVQPMYWLQEVRTMHTWTEVKAMLAPKTDGSLPDKLTRNRHFEVLVNPYPRKQSSGGTDHLCVITERNVLANPNPPDPRARATG